MTRLPAVDDDACANVDHHDDVAIDVHDDEDGGVDDDVDVVVDGDEADGDMRIKMINCNIINIFISCNIHRWLHASKHTFGFRSGTGWVRATHRETRSGIKRVTMSATVL